MVKKKGIRLVIYLDDFLILGSSKEECLNNKDITIFLLRFLGFLINGKKSDLIPSRSCKFLGLIIIDSLEMFLELLNEKRVKIKEIIEKILQNSIIKNQNLAECIGSLVATCPAIAYDWLFYKELESIKREGLLVHNNNYDKKGKLSTEAMDEFR